MNMQSRLEHTQQSPGGGGEIVPGGEIPEEDALLEILNGVGALRDASPAKVDRFSLVDMVEEEEEQVMSGRRRQQIAAVGGSPPDRPHEKLLPMRLSKEAPLAEILQAEETRAGRRRCDFLSIFYRFFTVLRPSCDCFATDLRLIWVYLDEQAAGGGGRAKARGGEEAEGRGGGGGNRGAITAAAAAAAAR